MPLEKRDGKEKSLSRKKMGKRLKRFALEAHFHSSLPTVSREAGGSTISIAGGESGC